jgi:hypothetical protein
LDQANVINSSVVDLQLGTFTTLAISGTPGRDPANQSFALVTLTWTAVTNAERYVVERSSTSSTTGFQTLSTVTTPGLTDRSLPVATNGWYRVTAYRGASQSRVSNVVGPVNVTAAPPPGSISAPVWTASYDPDGLVSAVVTGGSTATVSLDWEPVPESINGGQYRVEYSPNGSTGWTFLLNRAVPQADGSSPSAAQDTTLPVDTNRYYRVRGEVGSTFGTYSAVLGPVNVAAVAQGSLTFEQRWGNARNAVNVPIPGRLGEAGSAVVSAVSATAVSSLRQNLNLTRDAQNRPHLLVDQQVPPIHPINPADARSAPGVDSAGNNWVWYTGSSSASDGFEGQILCHSGIDPAGDTADNPVLIYMSSHPTLGPRVYFRCWQNTVINHTARTITCTRITPMKYGDYGVGYSRVAGGAGSPLMPGDVMALGWGRGWEGIIRRGDVQRGKIEHSLLMVNHDGWGTNDASVYWRPALKAEARSGTEAEGNLRLGMLFQLNPTLWTDTNIRARTVNEATGTNDTARTGRGPGSDNSLAWPANGGPQVTWRELLHMIMVAARDYGFYITDGGGRSMGFRMEHKLSAGWTSIIAGGETPSGGYGTVLRGVDTYAGARPTDGFPWGSSDLRLLDGGTTYQPKGA